MARTPEQWLTYLWKLQQNRLWLLKRQEDYYSGRHPLVFASPEFKSTFGSTFGEFSDNWCETVVTAAEERMNVEGFRFGTSGTDTDTEAWDIWQGNGLDLESEMAHTEALVHAESYWLVWPGDPFPRVTAEHPTQMIAVAKAANHREVAAAAKWYRDDDGYEVAWLYLPGWVYRYRSIDARPDDDQRAVEPPEMLPEDRDDGDGGAVQPNPFGQIVPVVPIQNRPRLTVGPRSEIQTVMAMQDLVNKLWVDLMVSSEFTADAQRWVLGWEPDRDENGAVVAPFQRRQRLWYFPAGEDGERLQIGQFQPGDLTGYLRSIETVVQHIASQTRTPPHYLNPSADRQSGESIKSSESGLVSKVRRKCRTFGEAHEQMIRLCFLAQGNLEKANFTRAETVWSDPEIHSEAQLADAMVKQKELGVPEEFIWARLKYTQEQIRQMKVMRTQERVASTAAQRALTLVPRQPVEPAGA
jgi:hypothetical protein